MDAWGIWVVPDAFIGVWVGNSHKKSDAVNPHRFPIYINVYRLFQQLCAHGLDLATRLSRCSD